MKCNIYVVPKNVLLVNKLEKENEDNKPEITSNKFV